MQDMPKAVLVGVQVLQQVLKTTEREAFEDAHELLRILLAFLGRFPQHLVQQVRQV